MSKEDRMHPLWGAPGLELGGLRLHVQRGDLEQIPVSLFSLSSYTGFAFLRG